MCEMVFWYFEYFNFNFIGKRSMGIIIWVVIFSVMKKIIVRLFMFVVLMGYGVVWLILVGIILKVFFFGVFYFLVLEVFEFVEYLGNINDLFGRFRFFLVLFVVLFDVCCIFWIFLLLFKILEKF